MDRNELFPAADDDGCEPFRKIAMHLKCTEYEALDAFRHLPLPEWNSIEHLRLEKGRAAQLNKVAQAAELLEQQMLLMTHDEQLFSLQAGMISEHQVAALALYLRGEADSIEGYRASRAGSTSRNPATYIIAEGIRRLFRRKRKNITFGQSEGAPTTDFCRAVEFGIGAFDIIADWKGPAKEAFEKHRLIEARLFDIKMHQAQRKLTAKRDNA